MSELGSMRKAPRLRNAHWSFRDLPPELSANICGYLPKALIFDPKSFASLLNSYPLSYIRVSIMVSPAWEEVIDADDNLAGWVLQAIAQMSSVHIAFEYRRRWLNVRLMELFTDVEQIKSIEINHNLIQPNALQQLASSRCISKLRQLRLGFAISRAIDTVQMQIAGALASVVSNARCLLYLDISRSELELSRQAIVESGLAAALIGSKLRHLRMVDVGLDSVGGVKLGNIVSHQNSLVLLECSENCLGDAGVSAIARSLETNKSLRLLALLAVDMTGLSGCTLAGALHRNSNLKVLLLKDDELGPECGKAFARMLESNQTLESLMLTYAGLGADGCRSFIKALSVNRVLTRLRLAYNGVTLRDKNEMVRVATRGKTLKVLEFADKNELSGESYTPFPIYEFLADSGVVL